MQNYKDISTNIKVLDTVVCDCCLTAYNDDGIKGTIEIEEFISINKINGYGSIFGDESQMKLDLCQKCVKKLLGDYIRIEGKKYE